jgi:hypothetical protein
MAPMSNFQFSRRSFLAMSATLPWALRGVRSGSAPSPSIPVGLELYSVRNELQKDPQGTVRAVAQMGYQAVESEPDREPGHEPEREPSTPP